MMTEIKESLRPVGAWQTQTAADYHVYRLRRRGLQAHWIRSEGKYVVYSDRDTAAPKNSA